MDGSLHEHTVPDNGRHQEDDQVVPDIDINQTKDSVFIIAQHVLMCDKVFYVLNKT